MTNDTKTISKKKPARRSSDHHKPVKPTAKRSIWIVLPIGLMVIVCLLLVVLKGYTLTYLLAPSFYDAFWFPPFPSLLVALFGVAYIYKTLRREYIAGTAKAIAYALLTVFISFMLFIAAIIAGKGQVCMGLSGAMQECSEVNASVLQLFFANPYSLVLLSGLAVAGCVSLFVRLDKTA